MEPLFSQFFVDDCFDHLEYGLAEELIGLVKRRFAFDLAVERQLVDC